MEINLDDLRVHQGESVDLAQYATRLEPIYDSKKHYRQLLKSRVKQLAKQQRKLYASNRYALLIVFQAMDTAGKDGAIRHVMSGVNPQGTQVVSFGHPGPTELEHDFLWRTTLYLPERGRIGIFNRSHYEEVLIVRVHPDILEAQNLPNGILEDSSIWQRRYESIRDYEQHLHRNGTRIVKFFLHISREEQRQRLLARIDNPDKNWKFSAGDVAERQYWDSYMEAYEQCLGATSTDESPWYVIPADDKKNARLLVSRVILDTIESLDCAYPTVTPDREAELRMIREHLLTESIHAPVG